MTSDEDAEIDELFAKMATEHRSEVNLLLRSGQSATGHLHHPDDMLDSAAERRRDSLRPSDTLRLFDVATLARWAKVPSASLAFAQNDPSVYATELFVDGMLCLERAKRRVRLPQDVLVAHEQNGCFEKLLQIEAFQVPLSGEQFLLCTTLSRRIDVENILTGSYVFLLAEGGSRAYVGEAVTQRVAAQPSVLKIAIDGFAILRERAVFVNFFYELLPWRASIPLPSQVYK